MRPWLVDEVQTIISGTCVREPAVSAARCTGFVVQAAFGGAIYSQNASYLTERFRTSASDGKRFLLPPGRGLGWARGIDGELFRC